MTLVYLLSRTSSMPDRDVNKLIKENEAYIGQARDIRFQIEGQDIILGKLESEIGEVKSSYSRLVGEQPRIEQLKRELLSTKTERSKAEDMHNSLQKKYSGLMAEYTSLVKR